MESEKDDDRVGLEFVLEMFTEFNEVIDMIHSLKGIITSSQSITERAYEKFVEILNRYHEQPHLLDSHIDEVLNEMIVLVRDPGNPTEVVNETFKYMYILIKVRGYKEVTKHLPHEVADFEPVLHLLEIQDSEDFNTWTTRYVLLLWLSIIVMIPFHMCRFDASDSKEGHVLTIMERVLTVCKTYVIVSDKCRDAAAFLTSKFLTRSDVKDLYLTSYFDWICTLSVSPDSNTFVKYGTLSSIAMILKHGKREDLLPHATKLLQWVIAAEFKKDSGIQKLVYKIVQRIGLTFLPPRIVSWGYKRGNRSLANNLSAGDGKLAICSDIMDHIEEDTSEEIEVPDELDEVIDQLIQGLSSGDGIVRWSAAKGIGRVTGRLSKDLADEVVGSILELLSPRESDSAWHGACLALAELGRRGLLLPERLPKVVPLVLKALIYDEPKGYSSVGSHIRDSACYVCWSFARAYDTQILNPFVNDIAATLLIVACFDREINCRRAASAAFQENVGRQGTFPHGIDILTTADFHAVSVRNNSYLEISVYIAKFDEYTVPLINHLLDKKIDHWDIAIRELTAKSLQNLTPHAPEYMLNTVLPSLFKKCQSMDLNSRHGSTLAIGEVLHAISELCNSGDIEQYLGNDILNFVKNLIPMYNERLYFRGMGGELMKLACSDLIHKCSLSHLPFHGENVIGDWLKLLNECLSYDVANVRMAAIAAFPAFFTEYFRGDDEEMQTKRTTIIRSYISVLALHNIQIIRMGHSLALGSLPAFMLKSHVGEVIDGLIESTVITRATHKWAESRRDSIKALTSICVTLEDHFAKDFSEAQIIRILNCLFVGLTEYTQDNRGDIGAWVREASMTGLQTLTLILGSQRPTILCIDIVRKLATGIVQQAVEKIDRTRALAGKVFYNLIHSYPNIPNIPNQQEIVTLFPKDECQLLNWNSAAVTFPKFVQLIRYQDYKYHLLLGLICSIGGMTETLVKNSSHSFFDIMKQIEDSNGHDEIVELCSTIQQIFIDHKKLDRIIIPMFRFLDKLFSSGCIACIINDPNSEFMKNVFKLIQSELNGCKDTYKLIDGISVLCQFIQVNTEVCSNALVQLSIFLCHRHTYVRRSTSTRFYESLLIYGDSSSVPVENLDAVMNLLSSTNWEESVDVVKPIRNELCSLMGVRIPMVKKKSVA